MLEVRSSDALPAWLAQRLSGSFPGSRARVIRVFPGKAARIKGRDGDDEFSVADAEREEPPRPIGADALLAQAVSTRQSCEATSADSGARHLVVLEAAGDVRYVVELTARDPRTFDAHLGELGSVGQMYFTRLADLETDPLTRLRTRRVFQSHLEAGLRSWVNSDRAYFLAMLDLDRFKRINDNFGHLYGDEILVHFANLLRRTFRAGDLLYRFGGEEFVLIYGVWTGESGEGTLERFRIAVEEFDFPGVGQVTVSIGFTRISDATTPAAILVDRADQAVYYAKAHGRNRVCGWEALIASGELKPKSPAAKDVTLF